MKKILIAFSFLMTVGLVSANAQCAKSTSATSGKSCCAKKSASVDTKAPSDEAMAVAASLDPTIEKVKAEDGTFSYQRKSVCEHSGSVSYAPVRYDEASAKFVSLTEGEGKSCAGKATGKACAKEASMKDGKACSSKSASAGKSCCASKGTQTQVAPAEKSQTKM